MSIDCCLITRENVFFMCSSYFLFSSSHTGVYPPYLRHTCENHHLHYQHHHHCGWHHHQCNWKPSPPPSSFHTTIIPFPRYPPECCQWPVFFLTRRKTYCTASYCNGAFCRYGPGELRCDWVAKGDISHHRSRQFLVHEQTLGWNSGNTQVSMKLPNIDLSA